MLAAFRWRRFHGLDLVSTALASHLPSNNPMLIPSRLRGVWPEKVKNHFAIRQHTGHIAEVGVTPTWRPKISSHGNYFPSAQSNHINLPQLNSPRVHFLDHEWYPIVFYQVRPADSGLNLTRTSDPHTCLKRLWQAGATASANLSTMLRIFELWRILFLI